MPIVFFKQRRCVACKAGVRESSKNRGPPELKAAKFSSPAAAISHWEQRLAELNAARSLVTVQLEYWKGVAANAIESEPLEPSRPTMSPSPSAAVHAASVGIQRIIVTSPTSSVKTIIHYKTATASPQASKPVPAITIPSTAGTSPALQSPPWLHKALQEDAVHDSRETISATAVQLEATPAKTSGVSQPVTTADVTVTTPVHSVDVMKAKRAVVKSACRRIVW